MSAETNDLISLLDSSIVTSQECLTGTLIDLTADTKPFQTALMTIAEVDDTFGLFTSKPRSNSAPESSSESTLAVPSSPDGFSKSVSNCVKARKKSCEARYHENSLSKGAISNISVENGSSHNTVISGSRAPEMNDGFVNSTIGDFEGDSSRYDSYNFVASTPMVSKASEDVFATPTTSPLCSANANNVSQERNAAADSSVESDLLDIENLSTFSISDSSDTSGAEMKKGKFDFLSPRKVKSPASSIARGKKEGTHLYHKNISVTRRVLAASNSEEISSDKLSSITSSSTPLVMALRKKMSEKAAQQKLDNRNETKAPVLSRRYFPSSHTDIISDNSKQLASGQDLSFNSPEPIKNEFVFPTPVKEYAEARKFTTPRFSLDKQGKGGSAITTPTKESNDMSRNVTAIVTPSRRSIAQPSTPSTLTRQLSTPTRIQYGSTSSLSNRTPISMRHSFSTSSSSSGSDVSRRLLTLDKVGPIPMKPLVTSFKPQATVSVAPQSKFTAGGLTKSSTLPRARIQPMKALPLAPTGSSTATGIKKASNTSITSQSQRDVMGKTVSAPVHRKFAHPPIASSSPKPPPRSTMAYSLGTPPRSRKETPTRSSGYGQQAMNSSRTSASPRLGETNNSRFLPKPNAVNKSEMVSMDVKRSESNVDMNSSKIARSLVSVPHHTQETKENNIRQLRKPTFGK